MMFYRSFFSASVATALCLSMAAFAAEPSPTLAPVAKPRPALANPVQSTLETAADALHSGQWYKAAERYMSLVNTLAPTQRAQARYGLALALSQLGQEDKAYTALEGTLRDDTPTGRAVGLLRARLALQLADIALARDGVDAAARWVDAYNHLPDQPDAARAARLRDAVAPVEPPAVAAAFVLNVGVMVPQTGELKTVGRGILRGLQLGLKEFDRHTGTRVVLHVVDVTDTASATKGAQALLAEKVDVVVGPLLGPTVDAARAVLGAAHVPLLSLSSDRATAGNGVYALNYLPAEQARAMAQAAVSNGKARLAALAPQSAYGYEAVQAFEDEATRLGAKVVKTAFYNPKEVDIGASIRTLMASTKKGGLPPFDALFIPAPAAALPLVTSQLSYYDVDKADTNGQRVQFLGTSLWQDDRLLAASATGVRGGLFAAPPRTPAFDERFRQTFDQPPHPLAILGYDAARIVTDIAAEKRRTGQNVDTLLLRPEGFYGTGGFARFTAGGVVQRGLALVKIGDQFETVQNGLNMAPLVRETTP